MGCFRILLKNRLITLDEITNALCDLDVNVRRIAVSALFKLGINIDTAQALCVVLEDSRREVTDLVLEKLDFERTISFEFGEDITQDSIYIDDLDQITSIIIDELIIRSSGRPKEIFNSK